MLTSNSPTELFRKVQETVWIVIAVTGPDAYSQGSAVAVGPNLFFTNCHVVEDAGEIALLKKGATFGAKIKYRDAASDICTLASRDGRAIEVAPLRNFDELSIGETVYTIGAPSGLELTLGNGIISGKRTFDGRSYIQTTAPISPGSSGGGLFDESGSLIGITTFLVKDSQALNFSIPADRFPRPE